MAIGMDEKKQLKKKKNISALSKQIEEEFSICDIPFLGCDFEKIYRDIASVLPGEAVTFKELPFENCIACEVICAAICHQMNWDYLRRTVLDKAKADESWLGGESLAGISEYEVASLFADYKSPERIREKERCEMLREVGEMVCEAGGYLPLFLDGEKRLLSIDVIRERLRKCTAFSEDPKEKKLQLLLQKLSNYDGLQELSIHCRPAIDYHLIRCYLRRGLLFPKTKYAKEFMTDSSSGRRESTVGALRHLCCNLLEQITWYTELDIRTVNLIEWNVGRSVCIQGKPDCHLENDDAAWLKPKYLRCPFYDGCRAVRNEDGGLLLYVNEPGYKGTSY